MKFGSRRDSMILNVWLSCAGTLNVVSQSEIGCVLWRAPWQPSASATCWTGCVGTLVSKKLPYFYFLPSAWKNHPVTQTISCQDKPEVLISWTYVSLFDSNLSTIDKKQDWIWSDCLPCNSCKLLSKETWHWYSEGFLLSSVKPAHYQFIRWNP